MPSTGKIIEICVSEGYKGQTPQGIRLGMTLEQVAREVGEPYEDDEDALLVTGIPGLALETTAWEARNDRGFDPNGVITHVFVFTPRVDD
ncbi:hypothetical protein [Haloferula sp. BvORR071]|uniref:hypothetical protein n=1 Tax=Haloferula sp. BvORR071 TaxID=1396141 RepID=UPI0022410029|nr:hypothetical protein [Haloferula sp. BvORR071]